MKFSIQIDDRCFKCSPQTSVLVAMQEAAEKVINVGCRSGGCGVCKIRILDGDYDTKVMSRAKLSVEEQGQGFALACRVFPKSDMKIEVCQRC